MTAQFPPALRLEFNLQHFHGCCWVNLTVLLGRVALGGFVLLESSSCFRILAFDAGLCLCDCDSCPRLVSVFGMDKKTLDEIFTAQKCGSESLVQSSPYVSILIHHSEREIRAIVIPKQILMDQRGASGVNSAWYCEPLKNSSL